MHATLFQNLLKGWHLKNGRILPWVNEIDPYKIWVSEIILQQTRVRQGSPYYLRFIKSFPDIFALANATEMEVFKHWEGLGYYSRAANLHRTAKYIVAQYNGVFPKTYNEIIKLKGIGPYTAAAISSFAFSLPHAVVDGNVHRVISRIFGIKADISTSKGRNEIQRIADILITRDEPGAFNQAMMDFGASTCLPIAPLCVKCIFADNCRAFLTSTQKEYPFKKQKPPLRNRYFQLFLIQHEDSLFLTYRKDKDIWKGLHILPYIETADEKWQVPSGGLPLGGLVIQKEQVCEMEQRDKQLLTHQRIYLNYHRITLTHLQKTNFDKDFIIVPKDKIKTLVFPKFLHTFIERNKHFFENK
jgi:A/G-specific adenine glycosylase